MLSLILIYSVRCSVIDSYLTLSLLQTHFEAKAVEDFCFQLYLTIKLSFMEIIEIFVTMLAKSSAADLLYDGKG